MAKKKRAEKYDEKLKPKGSFDEMMKKLFPPVKKEDKVLPKLGKPKK